MNDATDKHLELADVLRDYVERTLHVQLRLRPWPPAAQLPPYLRGGYRFLEGEIGATPVLWLLAEEPGPTPATLQKQLRALEPLWAGPAVVVVRALPAVARHRLTERGIPFVAPDIQLYLPDLGFDYRERARRRPPVERETLRPSAQALLLYLLGDGAKTTHTATDLAPKLGYTLMTMTRAFDELVAAGLVRVEKRGRPNLFRLAADPHDVWNAVAGRLRDPVTRRETVAAAWNGTAPLAGLSALAEYTMIGAPAIPVRAVGPAGAGELPKSRGEAAADWTVLAREENEQQVEVWSYEPRVLAEGSLVDRLSLYLSLRDDPDERVQQALEQLLEGVAW